MTDQVVCSVIGCGRPSNARGLCRKHYKRELRRSRVGSEPRTPSRLCTIDGCARAHMARGFCGLHYNRWRKTGDPNGSRRREPPKVTCKICGSPDRAAVDSALLTGAPYAEIGARFGYPARYVACHSSQHLVAPRISARCSICDHPDREAIEDARLAGRGRRPAALWMIAARFGVSEDAVWRHMSRSHQERLMRFELQRLDVLRSIEV